MAASAASKSAAVCDTSINSNPPGANSRAIAPASADGGTSTILGITSSPRRIKTGLQYVPIRPRHANPGGSAAEAGPAQGTKGSMEHGSWQRAPAPNRRARKKLHGPPRATVAPLGGGARDAAAKG